MTEVIQQQPVGENLRWLCDVYEQAQKLRIGVNNRLDAVERGADDNPPDPFVALLGGDLEMTENKIRREMLRELKSHPAWPWLEQVKGIGPTLACKILGLSYNCNGLTQENGTVSRFWSFAGLGVENGKRISPKKGEKRPYNTRLKTAFFLAGESFIKSRGAYRSEYDAWKHTYRERQRGKMKALGVPAEIADGLQPGEAAWKAKIKEVNDEHGAEAVWSDGHTEYAARRQMVKLFASHLWEVYREEVGLPVRPPYVLDNTVPGYQGHGTYRSPQEFLG